MLDINVAVDRVSFPRDCGAGLYLHVDVSSEGYKPTLVSDPHGMRINRHRSVVRTAAIHFVDWLHGIRDFVVRRDLTQAAFTAGHKISPENEVDAKRDNETP